MKIVNRFGFNLKMPYNLYEKVLEDIFRVDSEIRKEKSKLKILDRMVSEGLCALDHRICKQRISSLFSNKRELVSRKDAVEHYQRIKALNYVRDRISNKDVSRVLSEELNITPKHARTLKSSLLKHDFAYISGKMFYLRSNDYVWNKMGVETAPKGKKIKNLGVFKTVTGNKRLLLKKGERTKNGKIVKRNIEVSFKKKIRVPLVKIQLDLEEIRDIKLFRQAIALAFVKQQQDHDNSKTEPKQRKDAQTGSLPLSSRWFADRLGYVSTMSGFNIRKELEDCGFITVQERREVVEKVNYQEAKSKYNLQRGIQEDGWAYRYDKKSETVVRIQCFGVLANGYVPITYPRTKKKVRNYTPKDYLVNQDGSRMYLDGGDIYYELMLLAVGKTFKQILRDHFELLDDENPYHEVIMNLGENDVLEQANIKKDSGICSLTQVSSQNL